MTTIVSPKVSFAGVLNPYVKSQSLAGAVVAVADRSGVVSLEAVGYADIASNKPMQTDSLFWIASMTKPMTGIALMMLVDEGKLDLSDPVDKYIPEFKNLWVAVYSDPESMLLKKPSRMPTVRDLMCHTAGMNGNGPYDLPAIDREPLADKVQGYTLVPLHSHPGTKYIYSNMGINTGGRIIEILSGQSYEQFMQSRLFDPLGMRETSFTPGEKLVARLAKAYKPGPGAKGLEEAVVPYLSKPYSDPTRHGFPGGGLFSTAGDVIRFGQMLLAGGTFEGRRYISKEALAVATTKQTPAAIAEQYGVGFTTDPDGTFGHGGALATNLRIRPPAGFTTVYMVQHAGFPGNGGESLGSFWNAAVEFIGEKKA